MLGGMLWLAGRVAVTYLPTAKAASPASRNLSWRGGYPSEPWHRDLELRSTPTKTFTADQTLNVCQKTNRPVMIARSWRNRDGGRAKVQAIFARAWCVTRAPEHGDRSLGARRDCRCDATISTSASKPGLFNWMRILRQMPYFDLRHSDFFFTPARDLYRRCG